MRVKKAITHRGYAAFLAELTSRVLAARTSAVRAINRDLVRLYWDIGRAVAEKQRTVGWGDAVVERLAADLHAAFPTMRGFSVTNLWRMKQLYLVHTSPEFLSQAVRETRAGESSPEGLSQIVRELVASVPWGHHANVLSGPADPAARLYYLRATAQFGWSRSVLTAQVRARAFERAVKERKSNNFALALPERLAEQADEMMKSRYSLEFLGIGRAVAERDLEDRLVARLQQFILELGYGFCFVGRQHRLALGRKEYFVDLLFYHRFLRALVAFDLKVGAFEPEHAGKMDFYLNVLDDKERGPGDRPSIGIILCAEKDDVEVEYALRAKANPIGVAAYRLLKGLPAEFRGRLPSATQLAAALREEPMPVRTARAIARKPRSSRKRP